MEPGEGSVQRTINMGKAREWSNFTSTLFMYIGVYQLAYRSQVTHNPAQSQSCTKYRRKNERTSRDRVSNTECPDSPGYWVFDAIPQDPDEPPRLRVNMHMHASSFRPVKLKGKSKVRILLCIVLSILGRGSLSTNRNEPWRGI